MTTASQRYEQAAEAEYHDTADAYAARDEERWARPHRAATELAAIVARSRPENVAELGVGTGRYLPFVTGTRFVGVDVSPTMLTIARSRRNLLLDRGFTAVDLVQADLHDWLRAGDTTFDLVYAIGCLGYHVPVTVSLLRAIAGRLAPGGQLFLQTTQEDWRVRVKRAGPRLRDRRRPGTAFSATTTRPGLRARLALAGLTPQWIRPDDRSWNGRPMLLTLAERRRGATVPGDRHLST